jgi:hypothetical protein
MTVDARLTASYNRHVRSAPLPRCGGLMMPDLLEDDAL